MQLATITMQAENAAIKLEEYRTAVRRRRTRDEETRAIIAGYEALSTGLALVDLDRAIGTAGWDDAGRPRLAIARADRRSVRFRAGRDFACFDASAQQGWGDRATSFPTLLRRVPLALFPRQANGWSAHRRADAIVPLIPPAVVPVGAGPLASLFVLWEAEWTDVPVDPFLLRHLHGSLYAVLAQWDLTELEQAVLRGRLA